MPTLSVVKIHFLKVGKWLLIILGILIGMFLLIRGLFFIKELISPTPPPAPTVTFGKIPKPYFPQGIKKEFKFTIDTLSGELPQFPDRSKVYKLGKSEPDILAVERMSEKAVSLGFSQEAEQLSENVYRWRDPTSPNRILVVNVLLGEFNLSSDYIFSEGLLNNQGVISETSSINTAKDFLLSMGLYPQDLDETKTKTIPLKIDGGSLYEVKKPSETKIINIHFYQKDVDELPIVYSLGSGSSMQLTVAGGNQKEEVIDGRYFYQNRTEESATYPIITSEKAYDELKKGNAFIASHEGTDTNIVIKKVYLAYYSPGKIQDYLTPVVVFEGKDNFFAYVPAINQQWFGN